MKTIEQLLKPEFQTEIQTLLTAVGDYTLRVANDVKFDNRKDTKQTIRCVIKTSAGQRSNVVGIDAVTSSVSLFFSLDANYLQDFLAILNAYITATNNVVATVTDDSGNADIDYSYNISWRNPTGQVTSSILMDNETMNLALVMLSGDLVYSSQLALDDDELWVEVPDSPIRIWSVSNATYYNAQADANKGTSVLGGTPEGTLPEEDPEDYAIGFAMRKLNIDTVWEYFICAASTGTGYMKLNAMQQMAGGVDPTIEAIPLVNSATPSYKIKSEVEAYQYTFVRIPGDEVHNFFIGKFHATKGAAKFRINCKFKKLSTATTATYACILKSVAMSKVGKFEQYTISLIRE